MRIESFVFYVPQCSQGKSLCRLTSDSIVSIVVTFFHIPRQSRKHVILLQDICSLINLTFSLSQYQQHAHCHRILSSMLNIVISLDFGTLG